MSKKNILEKILPSIIKKDNNQEKEDYQFSKTTPNFFLSERPKPLEEFYYSNFQKMLTVSKIKEFTDHCKQKEIDSIKRNMRLKKPIFLQIMKTTFPSDEDFSPLFEQIFNRFKVFKAEIRCQNHRNDNYFLGKIIPEEEIEIYDICCALACFVKCDFENKIKLLFDITDIDDDGYVNENEVKRMIYSINYLFCDENCSNKNDSSLVSQSIASLNALKGIRMLLKHPGNLEKVLYEEKYINFQQFFNSILKVFNYKYDLIPLFVTLKKCLLTVKKEKQFEIKARNYNDFACISNEIVSSIKYNTDIGRTFYDFKKGLDKKDKERKFSRILTRNRLSNYIKKPLMKKGKSNNKRNDNLGQLNTASNEIKDDLYSINYNKICGLETYPGRLKIISEPKTDNTTTQSTVLNEKVNAFGKGILNHILNTNKSSGYMTLDEILSEITILINKHKIDDLIPEEMLRIEKKIINKATKIRNKLKDPAPYQNLVIGKVDVPKKEKIIVNKENNENNNNNNNNNDNHENNANNENNENNEIHNNNNIE